MNIIVATSNNDKIKEIFEISKNFNFSFSTLKTWCDLNKTDFPDILENGSTFEENSLIKSRTSFKLTQTPSIADDSGLVVPALSGKPGILSARYAVSDSEAKFLTPNEIYYRNREKLINDLSNISDRNAYFVCIVSFVLEEKKVYTFEGRCFGEISTENNCKTGFGYDPIFICKTNNKLFSDLSMGDKNVVSHRGAAMRKFFDSFTPLPSCGKKTN